MAAPGEPPHVAIVGAGWGGWGAAKAAIENGCRVTLLDALPDPTGATPYLTPTGKPFEAGTRGFWKDYPNIVDLVGELKLREEDIFTPFTNSSFYSPDGLEATAPVFSNSDFPELPSPIGQVVSTFKLFERIPVADRVTMLGLLFATIDFTRDEKTFAAYDRMTAHDLFIRMGISERLVSDFIRPTLLVGLFKPPEELSAAVAMELLYFYALAHQTSFDVRWIKSRSISELIISPLASALAEYQLQPAASSDAAEEVENQSAPALTVLGGSRVQSVAVEDGKVSGLTYTTREGSATLEDIDACVLALGSKGMQAVIGGSPRLASQAPELCQAAAMGGIDVIACRLWLDKKVLTRTPANVFSKFTELRGAGGTFFMLDREDMQGDDEEYLWGGAEVQGSVVACDFYNAGALLPLSDEDIVALLLETLLPSAVAEFRGATAVDSFVARYPGAVSWFSPGSFAKRPPLQTSLPNLVCAGDWVRMGAREHGAKGLCQERAYVSGLEAANALARTGALGAAHRAEHTVLAVRDDEPQVVAGRALNKAVMDALKPLGLSSPWVR